MSRALTVILIILCCSTLAKPCVGKFVNPITDICWSCLFPISIGPVPVNLGGQIDTKNPSLPICICKKPPSLVPIPGIPIGFWEPVRLVDVTRTPYCMVGLGGLSMGGGIKGHGAVMANDNGQKNSFYQVHYYVYPLIYWLELLSDFACMEKSSFDVGYMTELDVSWNNDEVSAVFIPEAALFANPIMQATCAADCVAASAGFSLDTLSWCGGCQGSLYPFGGSISNHISGVESSLLLTQRMLAKLHRMRLAFETSGSKSICQKTVRPVIKKSQYKTQMTYPKAHTKSKNACNPLGRTSFIWGVGREFPYKGEDFGYLIWRKKNCCVL